MAHPKKPKWSETDPNSTAYIDDKPTLGTAAAANTTDFATSAQGILADNAVPNTRTINMKGLSVDIDIDKSDVGLSNVDNTSDMSKPISTAQASAIALKQDSSAILSALSALPMSSNKMIHINNSANLVETPADSYGVGMIALTDAAAARAYIGAGTSTFNGTFAALTGKPTTLSGYGITDAYPLSGNPSSFITTSGARTAISITTIGTSGAATYNNGTGVLNIPQYSAPARSFNSAPGRSLVTGTGATGFQISSTRDALANYSVTITTAVQIGVITNVDGYVVFEIAPTNSATPGDWVEIARVPQAQNITLALALASTQKGGGQIGGVVPAGYYAKIRTVNVAGTPTYVLNSQQEVQL